MENFKAVFAIKIAYTGKFLNQGSRFLVPDFSDKNDLISPHGSVGNTSIVCCEGSGDGLIATAGDA